MPQEWADWCRYCIARALKQHLENQTDIFRQGKKVFDVELIDANKVLEIAEQLGYKGCVRVLLDSQTVRDSAKSIVD
jgi:hypothetical protein